MFLRALLAGLDWSCLLLALPSAALVTGCAGLAQGLAIRSRVWGGRLWVTAVAVAGALAHTGVVFLAFLSTYVWEGARAQRTDPAVLFLSRGVVFGLLTGPIALAWRRQRLDGALE